MLEFKTSQMLPLSQSSPLNPPPPNLMKLQSANPSLQDVLGQVVGSDHIALISQTDHTVSLVQLSNGFEAHTYPLGKVAEGRGEVTSMATLTSSHPCSLGRRFRLGF